MGVRVEFCINVDHNKKIYNLRSIQMTVCMCCNIRILIKPSTNNAETYRIIEILYEYYKYSKYSEI